MCLCNSGIGLKNHVDHAGPVLGKMLLIIVDSHSKWIEVFIVPSTSTSDTIKKLRVAFSTHGLPETLVSDNGTAYTSSEFQEFMKRNGVQHITTAPYHPSSNGLAERAVQTVKAGLRKMDGPLEVRIARFLLKYRVTPQTTTGLTPAELLMGRRLRTHLDLLYPTVKQRVKRQQQAQKARKERHPCARHFKMGDRVMARNFAPGVNWIPGIIVAKEGGVMFKVKLDDGRIWRRHVDHIVKSAVVIDPEVDKSEQGNICDEFDPVTMPTAQSSVETPLPEEPQVPETPDNVDTQESDQSAPVLRRSTRVIKPPDRLM